jgi:hypothetical protein
MYIMNKNELTTTVSTINNAPQKINYHKKQLYISVKVIIKAFTREIIFAVHPIFCIGMNLS